MVEDVFAFGESIGIPYKWYENQRPGYNWKTLWHDHLHELAHVAVYPQSALLEYEKARAEDPVLGTELPSLVRPWQTILVRRNYFINEYGVRCWARDTLKLFGWPYPPDTEGYGYVPPGRRARNLIQWVEPLEDYKGREQLANWGIDFSKGQYRPTETPLVTPPQAYLIEDKEAYIAELKYNYKQFRGLAD